MAVTKLSLYNDTAILLGERRLASDTEAIELRYDLDSLYDNGAVDYCLEIVKPNFALKLDQITCITPTLETAYTYEATLPANHLALGADIKGRPTIYIDGRLDTPLNRFTQEGDKILSDVEMIWVRYVQDFATVGLDNMPYSFGRVISAYMARELSWKYDPDAEEHNNTVLEQRVETSKAIETENEPELRSFAPDVLTPAWLAIYNDALQGCLKVDPITDVNDDSINKNRLDIALTSELVESVLEDTSWSFGLSSAQVFYDPGLDPAWGYQYGATKPANLHRMNGVYADEFFGTPIRNYIDEGGYILTNYQVIYLQFVDADLITDPTLWPSYFKRLVAARMALDAHIPGGNYEYAVAQYDRRRQEAFSTDAINGPPKVIGQGSWSRTRMGRYGSDRNRP